MHARGRKKNVCFSWSKKVSFSIVPLFPVVCIMEWKETQDFWEKKWNQCEQQFFLHQGNQQYHRGRIFRVPWQKTDFMVYLIEIDCGSHKTLYPHYQMNPQKMKWKLDEGDVLSEECLCCLK